MSPFKKVLCGLDLDDDNLARNAPQIIAVALAMAGDDPCRLHLTHVCDPPVTGYGEGTGNHHQMTEARIRQHTFPRLKQLLESHHLPAGQGHIIFGPMTDAIHQLAQDLGCDLIVIGNINRSILSKLLGSRTNNILQDAPCDVLTVNIHG